jgi:hypothetical protein
MRLPTIIYGRLLTADCPLYAAIPAVTLLVFQNSFEQVLATKVGPQGRCDVNFGISDLP